MVTPFQFGHVGPHEYLGALNPWQIVTRPSEYGIPFGTMEGRRPFYMNTELWQRLGLTNGRSVQFLGNRMCGKTAACKVYSYRSAALQVGVTGHRIRPSTDDTRLNAGIGEYKLWAQAFGRDYIDLSQFGLNIGDPKMGMSVKELTSLLRRVLLVSSGDMTMTERLALRSATGIAMHEAGDEFTHNDVGIVSASLSFEEHLAYIKRSRKMRTARRFANNSEHPMLRRIEDFSNISARAFKEASESITERFEILAEEYGQIFAGTHSMYDLLSDVVVALDFTKLDPDDLKMAEMVFWMWRNAAIRRHDHNLMAHIEIHDENWQRWQSAPWGRSMVEHLKKIRGSGVEVIKNQHRPTDILQAGEVGSVEQGQAITGLRETDVWLIGQTPRSEFNELRRYVNLPQDKLDRLPTAERGEFVVVIGDKVRPFTIHLDDLTDIELQMIESNQALEESMGE